MVGAIRLASVERGYDPREFALLAFGGAGPLHGGALARLLGIRTVLVPPAPGVLSALGLLMSKVKAEFARTLQYAGGRLDLDHIGVVYTQLQAQADVWLDNERVPADARRIARSAALRYRNQGFELFVPWAGPAVDADGFAKTIEAFHDLHQQLYTFAQRDTPVEIVTLRLEAAAELPAPAMQAVPSHGSASEAIADHVEMILPDGACRAPVYERGKLAAGTSISGPAIVTQLDSTTLLLPDQSATVHAMGSLIITDLQM
jgi:N-methylhydantoinase A